MDTADKSLALVHKLCAEQTTYAIWLSRQKPEEILKHAYEYSVRENIIACVDEIELTDAQLTALLAFPHLWTPSTVSMTGEMHLRWKLCVTA